MYVPIQTEKNPKGAVSVLQRMVKIQIHVINTHTCGEEWPDQRSLIPIPKIKDI